MANRFHYKTVSPTPTGHFTFNKEQTKQRFALCREALRGVTSFIRFNKVYADQEEQVKYAAMEWESPQEFDARLLRIECELGWNGSTKKYDDEPAIEGGFFPFCRYRGVRGSQLLDTGCIWIGNRHCYPRIYVDNTLAWWDEPYDREGYVAKDPFLPYFRLHEKINYFTTAHAAKRYSLNKVDAMDGLVL